MARIATFQEVNELVARSVDDLQSFQHGAK